MPAPSLASRGRAVMMAIVGPGLCGIAGSSCTATVTLAIRKERCYSSKDEYAGPAGHHALVQTITDDFVARNFAHAVTRRCTRLPGKSAFKARSLDNPLRIQPRHHRSFKPTASNEINHLTPGMWAFLASRSYTACVQRCDHSLGQLKKKMNPPVVYLAVSAASATPTQNFQTNPIPQTDTSGPWLRFAKLAGQIYLARNSRLVPWLPTFVPWQGIGFVFSNAAPACALRSATLAADPVAAAHPGRPPMDKLSWLNGLARR